MTFQRMFSPPTCRSIVSSVKLSLHLVFVTCKMRFVKWVLLCLAPPDRGLDGSGLKGWSPVGGLCSGSAQDMAVLPFFNMCRKTPELL